MIDVYIWEPAGLATAVADRIVPDFGHAAMNVRTSDGQETYISYWMELDGAFGQVFQLIKPREKRNPESYAEESDPAGPYMQRPADHVVEIEGVDEEKLHYLWSELRDAQYDFMHWNCSNVCKFLLLAAVDPDCREDIVAASQCSPEELLTVNGPDELAEKLRILATSPFIDCRPDDVRRMAEACLATAGANEE